MTLLSLSLCVGAVAGALDVVPMATQRCSLRSCLSAFCTCLFAAVFIFYSDLPYLPWWADGMAVMLMMTLPAVLDSAGKGRRPASAMLLNALVLGALMSVAEHFLK